MTGQRPTVRPAKPVAADGVAFARYLDEAADGLFSFMLGSSASTTVAEAFVEAGHDLSYEHVAFAEVDGEIVGMASAYSAETHEQAQDLLLARASGMLRARMLVVSGFAHRLFRFLDNIPMGDFYLQAVAVDPHHRGSGIGSILIHHTEGLARAGGAHRLALDVAVANEGARRLYERRGFSIEAQSPAVPLMGRTSVYRMVKEL